jgi:DNA modification methylase
VRDRLANSYEFVLHFVKSPNHYCSHRNVLDKDILNTFGFRISKKVAEGFKLPRNKYLVNFDRFSLDLGKDCTHSLPYRLSVNTKPFKGAHYAVYPLGILVNPFMMTTKPGDLVLDPFVGSGSTMHAAKLMGRKSIGIDINADYEPLVKQRLALAETALKDGV